MNWLREKWPVGGGIALGIALGALYAFAHAARLPIGGDPILLAFVLIAFRAPLGFQAAFLAAAAFVCAPLQSLAPMQLLLPAAAAMLAGNASAGKMEGDAFSIAHGRFALGAVAAWGIVALVLYSQTLACILRMLLTLMMVSLCFIASSVHSALRVSPETGSRTVSREALASFARR